MIWWKFVPQVFNAQAMVDQHQANFHFTFALIAFNQFRLHEVRFVQRQTRLVHHRLGRLEIALLSHFKCTVRQATRLTGVDDEAHHHFFKFFCFGLRVDDILDIQHTFFLWFSPA